MNTVADFLSTRPRLQLAGWFVVIILFWLGLLHIVHAVHLWRQKRQQEPWQPPVWRSPTIEYEGVPVVVHQQYDHYNHLHLWPHMDASGRIALIDYAEKMPLMGVVQTQSHCGQVTHDQIARSYEALREADIMLRFEGPRPHLIDWATTDKELLS